MRICEFVKSDDEPDGQISDRPPQNFGILMMHIQQYSSQSIEAYKQTNEFLYRGKYDFDEISIVDPRKDRKPLSSPSQIQMVIDEKLRAAGFRAIRSNSFFGTSSINFASQFGHPLIIFPFNGFKFTWSPDIKDLTIDLDLIRLNKSEEKCVVDSLKTMSSADFIQKYKFRQDGFEEALRSQNEVYICSKCVLISAKWEDQVRECLGMP